MKTIVQIVLSWVVAFFTFAAMVEWCSYLIKQVLEYDAWWALPLCMITIPLLVLASLTIVYSIWMWDKEAD